MKKVREREGSITNDLIGKCNIDILKMFNGFILFWWFEVDLYLNHDSNAVIAMEGWLTQKGTVQDGSEHGYRFPENVLSSS